MIALQIAVYVLMDLTIVHTSASGDPRASHWSKGFYSCVAYGFLSHALRAQLRN